MAGAAPPLAQATLVASVPDYNELVREIRKTAVPDSARTRKKRSGTKCSIL